MSQVGPVELRQHLWDGVHSAASIVRSEPSTTAAVEDRVEISQEARELSEQGEISEIRFNKVLQLRAAIERGDYITPEKLDEALRSAIEDL